MSRIAKTCLVLLGLLAGAGFLFPTASPAHFGVLLPSDDIVEGEDARDLAVSCMFMHPFEQEFMDMARPRSFGVRLRGTTRDLLPSLEEQTSGEYRTWTGRITVDRPGDYVFFLVPEPYWEPAEGLYIQHHTKVVVNGFGLEEGWSEPLGLKTEIVPLVRPYGLWTGNIFTGRVVVDGKPAPDTEVEVEYFNAGEKVHAPAGPYITQVVLTDSQGIFSYAMPREGWWGFSALTEGDERMVHDGKEVGVELGAVIWVHVQDMR